MQSSHLKQIAFVLHLWAATLFLFASIMFLIEVSKETQLISASCFIAGSILFTISNSIQTYLHTDIKKIVQSFFILANLMFLAASITFLPSVNHALIGNWLFQIASWIIIILQAIKLKQLYDSPTKTWLLQIIYRVLTTLGAILFVVGNILLINNAQLYLIDAFIVFTSGCTCFVVGGTSQMYLQVKPATDSLKVTDHDHHEEPTTHTSQGIHHQELRH